MTKTIPLFALALLVAGIPTTAAAREVRLQDCPPAVRSAIERESRGGRLDEIEFRSTGRYVAEIDLTGNRDRMVEVAADGRVVRRLEDVRLAQVPKTVRAAVRRLQGSMGRLDELERETKGRKETYRVEIDYPNDRETRFVLSKNGTVLR